jgi:hypothetical protein
MLGSQEQVEVTPTSTGKDDSSLSDNSLEALVEVRQKVV